MNDLALKQLSLAASYAVWVGVIATAGAFTLYPLRHEHTAGPGKTVQGTFQLTNDKENPVELQVSWRNVFKREGTGDASWLSFVPSEVTLGPAERVDITYTATVPPDGIGELSARVTVGEKEKKGAPVSVRSTISVHVYVAIGGTEIVSGLLHDAQITSFDPVQVKVQVENQGNVHTRPKGVCVITERETGQETCRLIINEPEFPTYPGQKHVLWGRLKQALGPGSYTAAISLPFPDEQNALKKTWSFTVPAGRQADSASE